MSLLEDEFMIRRILLTHDPDGRQVDSELLLQAVENVICNATPEIMSQLSLQVYDPKIDFTNICNIGGFKLEETVKYTLIEIQHEIIHRCFNNQDLHSQAMFLLEMLERFGWDAKVALVFAAFGMSYGECWLTTQFEAHNHLAALISALKNLPSSVGKLRKQFKSLTLLINTMLEVSRTIVEFESLPLQQEFIENKALAGAKAKIYIATYWIFRSSITCSSLIAGLGTVKHDKNSSSRTIASGTFSNLVQILNALSDNLKEQLHIFRQHTEAGLFRKLQNLFNETHGDNQEVLHVLFALKDDFPFKSSSQEKFGIHELKNKVVILLISKPELLPVERIYWLVKQIHDHPEHDILGEKYAIIWLPILYSSTWNQADVISYQLLSNSLPFFSVRQPWSLNPAIRNYIKKQWDFQEEPTMVVLDENGGLTNSNALDMVWIWGAKAFPFSTEREKHLWEHETSMLKLIADGINLLLTSWVEGGKHICLYGSDNLDWIRQLNIAITEIRRSGIQLEVIYVGWRNPGEHIRNIVDIISQENLSTSLSFTKIRFFWHRMESIKNSISRLQHESAYDGSIKKMSELIDIANNNKGFVIIGTGTSADVVNLQGEEIRECFDLFPLWAKNVATMGLATAIRNAVELPLPDRLEQQSDLLPYEEGLTERISICSKCRRTMEKVVVYSCNGAE